MQFLKALARWFQRADDQAAKAIDDPVGDAPVIIRQSREEAGKFEKSVAQLMADNKGLAKQKETVEAEVAKWAGIAQKAAKGGNTQDARSALEKQMAAEKQRDEFTLQIGRNDKDIASYRKQLDGIRRKIAQAQTNLTVQSTRVASARMRKAVAAGASDLQGSGSALAKLEELGKVADQEMNEAEALEELSGGGSDQALEEKYGDPAVDSRLEALMQEHQSTTAVS